MYRCMTLLCAALKSNRSGPMHFTVSDELVRALSRRMSESTLRHLSKSVPMTAAASVGLEVQRACSEYHWLTNAWAWDDRVMIAEYAAHTSCCGTRESRVEYVAVFLATDFLIVRAMSRCREANEAMMLLRATTRYLTRCHSMLESGFIFGGGGVNRVDSETGGLQTRASAVFLRAIFN